MGGWVFLKVKPPSNGDHKHDGDYQELATNPDNLLLFTSLVVTTVFVAQVRIMLFYSDLGYLSVHELSIIMIMI